MFCAALLRCSLGMRSDSGFQGFDVPLYNLSSLESQVSMVCELYPPPAESWTESDAKFGN